MPPFSESLTSATTSTSTSFASGGYISYPTITSAPIHISFEGDLDKRMNEYVEKVEQHVDHLEEDIDYFNQKMEKHEERINEHEASIEDLINLNGEKDTKIATLEGEVEFLKNYTNYLEGRIMALEDKMNDKVS